MLGLILERWEDLKLKKTVDDTQFKIKKVFLKSHFKSSIQHKQVLVKNIGNCSKKRLENALSYVIKNSNEKATDQDGKEVSLNEILDDWRKDFSQREDSKEGYHLVFSINEEVNAKNMRTLEKAVRDTMQKNFFQYKFVLVKHTHQNNPHIHVIVNKNNIFTRKKMHFKTSSEFKEFFNTIRDDFAMALNFYDPKLKYQNLLKHDRDLELRQIQEIKNQDLNLKLEVENKIKKLEIESTINFNKIEKNSEKIKELRKEQRQILSLFKKASLDEILELQKSIDAFEKQNQSLRNKNKNITKIMRDFKELNQQIDLASPFSKKKTLEFLKKNPKMLTLKQIVALPKIEKTINREIEEIQSFHSAKLNQEIKHNMSLGSFQKTSKIFEGIKECQINVKLFPEQKEVFEKNIRILEKFLNKRSEILGAKIDKFGDIEASKQILESENKRIENYLGTKRQRIDPSQSRQIHRSLNEIFQEIDKLKNCSLIQDVSKELQSLETMLDHKMAHNQKVIGFIEKNIKSKEFLQKEKLQIEAYFQMNSSKALKIKENEYTL